MNFTDDDLKEIQAAINTANKFKMIIHPQPAEITNKEYYQYSGVEVFEKETFLELPFDKFKIVCSWSCLEGHGTGYLLFKLYKGIYFYCTIIATPDEIYELMNKEGD